MLKISIPFDDLRVDAKKVVEFAAAYSGAELGILEETLLYSQLTENNAVFMFEGLPSGFDSKEVFSIVFRKRIFEIAAPFLAAVH